MMKDLLRPISQTSPSGDDMTFSAEFDLIREARRQDDPLLSQGEWTRPHKSADWQAVVRQCESLLKTRTKDLQLVCWHGEACARLKGLRGVTEAYELATALCRDMWDTLHPSDDPEERLGHLRWLVTQSATWVRQIDLGDGLTLEDVSPGTRARPEKVAEARKQWRTNVSQEQRGALSDDVRVTQVALDSLDEQLHARFEDEAPSVARASDALEEILNLMGGDSAEEASTHEPRSEDQAPQTAPLPPPKASLVLHRDTGAPLTSRAEALESLREVARFFRETEPHSPVAYLADKAARWGDMPLHTWLHTVLGDGEAYKKLGQLLDIDQTTPAS